jgi:hypothetical protein
MKVYYDSEFLERGSDKPVSLISIAFVAEDGRELYLVDKNAPWDEINNHAWLVANVLPYLEHEQAHWCTKEEMKDIVYNFLMAPLLTNKKSWPELYAWYSSYDHLMLAQIFGTMLDFPNGVPMYTHDVRSLADWFGVKSWPKQVGGNHCALDDARHLRKIYDHILEVGTLKLQPNSGKN